MRELVRIAVSMIIVMTIIAVGLAIIVGVIASLVFAFGLVF